MPLKTKQEELPAINLTSMIDVVFLLIIFFMVGTRFTDKERTVTIDLPSGMANQTIVSRPPAREVTVAADGTISMDDKIWSVEQLSAELKRLHQSYPDIAVEIRGDRNVAFGRPLEVFTAVRAAGIKRVEVPFSVRR